MQVSDNHVNKSPAAINLVTTKKPFTTAREELTNVIHAVIFFLTLPHPTPTLSLKSNSHLDRSLDPRRHLYHLCYTPISTCFILIVMANPLVVDQPPWGERESWKREENVRSTYRFPRLGSMPTCRHSSPFVAIRIDMQFFFLLDPDPGLS